MSGKAGVMSGMGAGSADQAAIAAAICDLVRALVPLAIDAAIQDGRLQAQPAQGANLDQRRYLNEDEVFELYGVKKSTLSHWRRKSMGPEFCKRGKRIMYARPDLDAYFGKGRIRTLEADSRSPRAHR